MSFKVSSGLDLPRGDQWPTVVTVFLAQTNERLDSTRVLLHKNHWDSALILTRSLFELAANLTFIALDIPARLPEYLTHGAIPLTSAEAEQLRAALGERKQPEPRDFVPGYPWKSLRDICTGLGSGWIKEYETFYRYASVPTHAGSFTLGKNYAQLLDRQRLSDNAMANVLTTALAFQLRVAEIAAGVFPEEIALEQVKQLRSDCETLGYSLVKE